MKSLHERINERYKTDKATLYSTIGFLRTNHTLRLTNRWNETQTYQYSTDGTDDKALEEGLKIARQESGPTVRIDYSNAQNQVINEAANTRLIDKSLNEAYTASEVGKDKFRILLG